MFVTSNLVPYFVYIFFSNSVLDCKISQFRMLKFLCIQTRRVFEQFTRTSFIIHKQAFITHSSLIVPDRDYTFNDLFLLVLHSYRICIALKNSIYRIFQEPFLQQDFYHSNKTITTKCGIDSHKLHPYLHFCLLHINVIGNSRVCDFRKTIKCGFLKLKFY